MQPDRASAILAVIRIIAVLGMSVAIAAGLFILLWGKILLGLAVCLIAIPFFWMMRYMETHYADGRPWPGEAPHE